jgi:hypothetical protein
MNRYGDKWVNARGTRVAVGYWSPQPLGLIAASLLCGLAVALVGNWAWGQDPELPAAEKVPSAEKAPATESAQDVDVEALLNKAATAAAAKQQYELKYKFRKGDTLRWQVEHTATTKTHMANETEEMSSRSKSVRCWKVVNVDSKGNMVFEHSIESLEAWERVGETEPIAYNSQTDSTPPAYYESTAEKLGRTLATLTVAPTGQIVNRQSNLDTADFGMGDVLIPMPDKPIAIGHRWSVPKQFQAENEEGEVQQFAARVVYELQKVVDGQAYLTFKTEVLTPLNSEKAHSQLLAKLSRGVAVFDLEQGLIAQRTIEWNEKVQGFEGPDSLLQYLAKLTEKLVTGTEVGAKQTLEPKR